MKTIENVTIYKCDFCKKELKRKYAMVKHEIKCFHNPVNFSPCFNCSNLEKKEVKYYFDTFQGESSKDLNLFHCKLKQIFLYPATSDINNVFELGDDFNEKMPKECDLFSNDFEF